MPRLPERCALLLLTASMLGCQTPPPAPPPETPLPVTACPEPAPPPQADELRAVLAYARELRLRGVGEPTPATDVSAGVAAQAMRRALLLSQGRGSAELTQAAAQLDIVAAATEPQAAALKPLAELLAGRIAEQRRLQESLDKLGQQLRDSQRRNDQLNEKLEALKAIEQTLPAKPVTPPR